MNSSTVKRSEEEIRDLQEKKNYQDFVYQTNQSLQNLQVQLLELNNLIEKNSATVGRHKTSTDICFDKIKEEIDKNVADNLSVLNSFRDILTLYKDGFESRIQRFQKDHERLEECEKECHDSSLGLEKLDARLRRLENYIESSIREVHGKIQSSLCALREELTPTKPEKDPTEEKVKLMIEAFRIDHQGLVREMEVVKKVNNYNEKKIEKLLTDFKSLGNK